MTCIDCGNESEQKRCPQCFGKFLQKGSPTTPKEEKPVRERARVGEHKGRAHYARAQRVAWIRGIKDQL